MNQNNKKWYERWPLAPHAIILGILAVGVLIADLLGFVHIF